jgi:membrane-associated phospholipid phosphatase
MENFLHDISWVVPWRSETLTLVFNAFTLLGYPEFFLVFLPFGYWLWDKAMFTRLAILIGVVGISNTFLKDLFQDPRPPIEFAVDPRVGDSFGLPSGHAQVATAMWLWLAYEMRRAWAWVVAIVIVIGVGLSRLYLGVHDVEDVLAGTLLGLFSVAIYRVLISDTLNVWHNLNVEIQVLAIAATAPLLWMVWPRDVVPIAIFGLVSFITCWWIGRAIDERFINYERHENWVVAGVASIAGVVVMFALFKVMGDQFAAMQISKLLGLSLQFGFISLYVTAIAPAIFRLSRLAW